MIEYLVSKGADINAISQEGRTVLHEAWENRDEALAVYFIVNGADIEIKHAIYGTSLLHWAAEDGLVDLAELLVTKGIDINVGDRSGETPLQTAVRNDQHEMADLLKRNGAE